MFDALRTRRSAGVPVTRVVHRAIAAGNAARGRSDWISAARHYERALSIDPTLTHIWVQVGHMYKERHAWEQAVHAYARAATQAPADATVIGWLFEIAGRLGDDDRRIVTSVLEASFPNALFRQRPSGQSDIVAGQTVFDVSDLVSYFARARVPTGIQRVQIEIIRALQKDVVPPRICCAIEGRGIWIEIPIDVFARITDIATGGDRFTAGAWVEALAALQLSLLLGEPMNFGPKAILLNLGTSWWLQNYFLQVRNAQAAGDLEYIPFVHDLIPVMAPEHCVEGLVEDFVFWVTNVFTHARRFLVNSEATKRDLLTVADRLGHSVSADAVTVVRLDAGFAKPELPVDRERALARFGLGARRFVLFVSTIESRKDHVGALRAWQSLIARHGDACPALVCVGNDGWLNEAFYALLAADATLRSSVVLLTKISDQDLALLYEQCVFTIYPSTYEGWGLPVTEALSYGKPVVVADNSSLPEAGGALATYFRTGDLEQFTDLVEQLSFDDAYRGAVSQAIVEQYRPRTWTEVAHDIATSVSAPAASPTRSIDRVVDPGAWYDLSRSRERTIWRGSGSAEMFRAGPGWGDVDRDGAWVRDDRVSLVLDLPDGRDFRFIMLLSAAEGMAYEVAMNGATIDTGVIAADHERWVVHAVDRMARQVFIDIKARPVADRHSRPASRTLCVGGFAITGTADRSGFSFLEAKTLNRLDRITAFRDPSRIASKVSNDPNADLHV